MSELFSFLFTLSLLLLPLLTMRLMSEEKKQKTDQLLLTSPVSLTGLVLGKFLAAFLMFLLGL
jgi:ABC-2 type transport system permease protein